MGYNDSRAIWTVTIFTFAFPLILIHGYSEDASVWDSWEDWLKDSNITKVHSITFNNDDECGTVQSHAAELNDIINETVNMVTHSKGGLDARQYISTGTSDNKVANLIMIGTPNEGTPAAYMDLTECAFYGSAGLANMMPDSEATKVTDQNGTNYYTISGDYPAPCFFSTFKSMCYAVPNDGFVTVDSAKSHYESLGTFPYNHTGLLAKKDVYQKVLPIISNNK